MGELDAAVYRLGAKLAINRFAHHHGTGTAVAFVAAFFGAGAVQVFPQNLQQGSVDIDGRQAHHLAVAQKLQGLGLHGD